MSKESLKRAREVLNKLTYIRYHDINSYTSPYICDNLIYTHERLKFKKLANFKESDIQTELGYDTAMYLMDEFNFNKVQKVRLLLLDLLIEAYDDIK